MAADVDSLGLCPGIGPLKARRLHTAFTTSYIKQTKPVAKRIAEQAEPEKSAALDKKTDKLRDDDDIIWSEEEDT